MCLPTFHYRIITYINNGNNAIFRDENYVICPFRGLKLSVYRISFKSFRAYSIQTNNQIFPLYSIKLI